jgi:hypothetical protein
MNAFFLYTFAGMPAIYQISGRPCLAPAECSSALPYVLTLPVNMCKSSTKNNLIFFLKEKKNSAFSLRAVFPY